MNLHTLRHLTRDELLAHAEINATTPLELAMFETLLNIDPKDEVIADLAREVIEATDRDERHKAMDKLAGAFR